MKKTKLTLSEVLQLEQEINGDPQMGLKGVLSKELPFRTKYWLSRLGKKLLSEKTLFDEQRNELIIKLGEKQEGGSTMIPTVIEKKGKKIPNPAIEEFRNEIEKVLTSEIEIEHSELYLLDFDGVKLEENTTVLFSLIDEQ